MHNINIILAHFMDRLETDTNEYYHKQFNSGDWFPVEDLGFHLDYGWLMPVVEKIGEIWSDGGSLNGTLENLSFLQDRDGIWNVTDLYSSVVTYLLKYYDLKWNDPDPIEGNDYSISWIKFNEGYETALIEYGGGSEAEVLISEIKLDNKVYEVDGYWKEDKSRFEGVLICEFDSTPVGFRDDEIFFHGLSFRDMVGSHENDALDFVITKIKKYEKYIV